MFQLPVGLREPFGVTLNESWIFSTADRHPRKGTTGWHDSDRFSELLIERSPMGGRNLVSFEVDGPSYQLGRREMRRILPQLCLLLCLVLGAVAAYAQDGACRLIDQLPFYISESGEYCLTGDLHSVVGDSIFVDADDVAIDFDEHTITGPAIDVGAAIYKFTGHNRITVRGGTINGYSVGIILFDGSGHRVEDMQLVENRTGIILRGNQSLLSRNEVLRTQSSERGDAVAIYVEGQKNKLIDNVIVDTRADDDKDAYGLKVNASYRTSILGTRIVDTDAVLGNAYGIHIDGSRLTRIEQNATLNLFVPGLVGIEGGAAKHSACAGNYVAGFALGIANCTDARGNTIR